MLERILTIKEKLSNISFCKQCKRTFFFLCCATFIDKINDGTIFVYYYLCIYQTHRTMRKEETAFLPSFLPFCFAHHLTSSCQKSNCKCIQNLGQRQTVSFNAKTFALPLGAFQLCSRNSFELLLRSTEQLLTLRSSNIYTTASLLSLSLSFSASTSQSACVSFGAQLVLLELQQRKPA